MVALPVIIQGGMGVGVSSWTLARAVGIAGQFGVVSGTGLDSVLVRRLQAGDEGGHLRRVLASFPVPDVAERILTRYFVEGGKSSDRRFRASPMPGVDPPGIHGELLVVSNYAEVALAKEGHDGPVGINYLEKIQAPTLASTYGAMLAGVDVVLMGAGIPRAIPGILDHFSSGKEASLRLDVKGATEPVYSRFDPVDFWGGSAPMLPRPRFFPIVSSHVLGKVLHRGGGVDGFIIEGPTAGGHNAPPRSKGVTASGEPAYDERDVADLEVFRDLGLPFWLAGGFAEPGRLVEALEAGAAGIQVGTAFAFCDESGLTADLKRQTLDASARGDAAIVTDGRGSPTGFPFKVIQLDETLSGEEAYGKRDRVCDLGYLRQAYVSDDGSVDWRCPAEPADDYIRKGGDPADLVGRKCLCNALMSNIGLGQLRGDGRVEVPLLTAGDDVVKVARFLPDDGDSYSAADVIAYLLGSA